MVKEKRKVNVKVMETLTAQETSHLVEALKKIEGFEFHIDVQFKLSR